MTGPDLDLVLTDATRAGVVFVDSGEFDAITAAADHVGLLVRRVDLDGCHDKHTLLTRLAASLAFPSDFGGNWDALSDSLRDLAWLPAPGYVLLLDNPNDLRGAHGDPFGTALDIFDEAARDWAGHEVPFWILIARPAPDFDLL